LKFQSLRGIRGCASTQMERVNRHATFAMPRRRAGRAHSPSVPCAWYALSLDAPSDAPLPPTTTGGHVRAEQPSGELLRVVLTLARRALDGNERSDHGLAARVRLTVKASASAAAGPGVRPSATCLCSLRHTGNGGVLHHLQGQSRDRLGPPRSPCKGAAAPLVAQCTVGPALRARVVVYLRMNRCRSTKWASEKDAPQERCGSLGWPSPSAGLRSSLGRKGL
jgi:hypothetical protein